MFPPHLQTLSPWGPARPPRSFSVPAVASEPDLGPARHSLAQRPDRTRNHPPDSARTRRARLRAIATSGDHSQRTAKAIAWIKANYAKPLRVEDLAHIAAMSVSTFHRVLTAMSPLQYQKQLRLQAARGRMLMDASMRQVPRLRLGTKAPVDLIVNTAASSANHRCVTSGPYAPQTLHS